jgi:enamine deaminase RidA (YjgF/YER057c/UK114 family)
MLPEHGNSRQPPGDGRPGIALDNLEAILAAVDMTLASVVRLNAYTTDLDELFRQWTTITDRFPASGTASRPACWASRSCRHSSSSCSKQPPLPDRQASFTGYAA